MTTWGQALLHRYSFDADANDLIGGAHGELGGNALIVNGAVSLDGMDAFVDLPNDLVSSLTNVTFEIWATWNGGPTYQALFSFGSNPNGEGLQGSPTKVIYLTPNNGSGLALTIFTNAAAQRSVVAPALQPGSVHQIVWTHDAGSSSSKIYIDGLLTASSSNVVQTLSDLGVNDNNWLGRSQYPWDPDFDGSIAEFRIYDGVLSEEAVAANYRLGPDPGGKGAVLSLEIRSSAELRPGGSRQLVVLADFEKLYGFSVSSDADIRYEVSDPAVLSVTPAGVVTAVGDTGSAQVTARLGGQSVSQTIRIVPLEPPVLRHRYSFDTDASDSAGDAHGELLGNAVIQRGAVVLDGTNSYVNLPNDLVQGLTNATFEVWTTWNSGNSGNWQRIIDFGNSTFGEDGEGYGYGLQSILLTPNNGSNLEVSIFTDEIQNEQTVGATPLELGSLHQIVWAYDAVAQTAWLYVDGVEVGVTLGMTHTLSDLGPTVNNWLGRSQYSWDPYYNGSIAEFRIYEGVLSPEKVAENYLLGPDPAGRGAPLSLVLELREVMRVSDWQQLRVLANFERAERLDVTRDANLHFSVSDPSILNVTTDGELNSLETPGQSTLTISYLGISTNASVQIWPNPESHLIHRYSFDGNAQDSIGGANGVLKSNAIIQATPLCLMSEVLTWIFRTIWSPI
ncbi:MAG: hypothetical protein KIT22_06980 [Verrucomicrobiae bacterium]|nr:hypothetical protein [Verrucomicrobiae bacterium]